MFQFNKFRVHVVKLSKRLFSSQEKSPSNVWEIYNHQLQKNPLKTKCITAGVIAAAADVTCQAYFPEKEEDKAKRLIDRYDLKRSVNFILLNTIIFPVVMHHWYGFLATKIVGNSVIAAAKRVFFDQSIFAPTVIAMFLAGSKAITGEFDAVSDKLKQDWAPALLMNWMVWIPAQLINFYAIPGQYHVLWANLVGYFWNVYLSSLAAKGKDKKQ